jgi:hypothetical protein
MNGKVAAKYFEMRQEGRSGRERDASDCDRESSLILKSHTIFCKTHK